jgi:hypothetical protein
MPQPNFHFGWQRNYRFNNWQPAKEDVPLKPEGSGAVSSVIIAFAIFLGIAFFLSFLNQSLASRETLRARNTEPPRIEISLRV